MKIIQSFAKFKEGSPYLQHKRGKENYVYLNFYCALLSYLTISEKYGPITMFCNQDAYDSFIKYIPYDYIIIKENTNPFEVWNKYKIDVMRTIDDDIIHIDSDVFLLGRFYDEFINGDYDIMVQDILPKKENQTAYFGYENKEFLAETKILTKQYDGRCMSCGSFGLRKKVQPYFYAGVDVLYKAMLDIGVNNIPYATMIIEELLLYMIAYENDFTVYEILPEDLMKNFENALYAGDSIGYLHMWMQLKYRRHILDFMRKKIFYEYPTHYHTILKYENDVMSKFKYFYYMNFTKIYG